MATDNKTKILRDAERYVMQGKLSQAIAEYLKLTKADPNDVLTLNTIGDLELRLGKTQDATRHFSQVAECYVRDNFLLKAIAVYKKILSADPDSREVNAILAGLYVKQGMTIDARNQYLRLAEMFARDGKAREATEAYEKVVELDPSSFAVQLKLADIYLGEGGRERARAPLLAAARAQVKSGAARGALESYRRAVELNPVDLDALRGYLEAATQAGDVPPVLEALKHGLVAAPDDAALRELLGQAQLNVGDLEGAARTFQAVLQSDESRYEHFFELFRAHMARGDFDHGARALDTVVPILITRRETERAVDGFHQILVARPQHALSLTLLLKIYAAVSDTPRQLEVLDQLAAHHMSRQNPREALEYLEQILQLVPDSEKHKRVHADAFREAYPDRAYVPPALGFAQTGAGGSDSAEARVSGETESALIEVDLLLNYGMHDKALATLLALEARGDRQVHQRLATLYREGNQPVKAAEQHLKLAALCQAAGDEAGAVRHRAEARQLAPELVVAEPERPRPAPAAREVRSAEESGELEIDLSHDLSSIFFDSGRSERAAEAPDGEGSPDTIVEKITRDLPKRAPSEGVGEQIQEVDFYIRLGFMDEARAKLEELAAQWPDSPEVLQRRRKIAETAGPEGAPTAEPEAAPIALGPGAPEPAAEGEPELLAGSQPASGEPVFGDLVLDLSEGLGSLGSASPLVEEAASVGTAPGPAAPAPPQPPAPDLAAEPAVSMPVPAAPARPAAHAAPPPAAGPIEEAPAPVNAMFADLIDEVNLPADPDTAREEFETHFNLGIAYRGMDLVEDAIREFESAVRALNPARAPREMVQCCGMLSTCFLERGMHRSAIRWCQTGLSVPDITPFESMALRYDLGLAYTSTGERERALEALGAVFDADPSYRDVAQRLDHLKGRA